MEFASTECTRSTIISVICIKAYYSCIIRLSKNMFEYISHYMSLYISPYALSGVISIIVVYAIIIVSFIII